MLQTRRHKWIIQTIADSFNLNEQQVEDLLTHDKHFHMLNEFLDGKGSSKIFIYYQPLEAINGMPDPKDTHYELFITGEVNSKLKGKVIYFFRNLPEGKSVNIGEACDNEVLFGELSPNTIVQTDGVINVSETMIGFGESHEWMEGPHFEKIKADLQAPLIIRHNVTNKPVINLDLEIFEMIREAKRLEECGKNIPESARVILLQEEKFKLCYNELNSLLGEYERIISKIKQVSKDILRPHIEDFEFKLRPGMLTLTWTSMNIDSYLRDVHEGLAKLEHLITIVNDIIENRVENNLKAIAKVLLVDLPQGSKSLSLEEFVKMQQESIQENTEFLVSKNLEVEKAVDNLLEIIMSYPLDTHVDPVSKDEARKIKCYYMWHLYQALLNSTENSINAMKNRVVGKRGQGGPNSQVQLNPIFEVDVQLDGTVVNLNPSLEDIEKAINKAANAVLQCTKNLYKWNQEDSSVYELIAQEKEIVKVIIYLAGSLQGAKNKVNETLASFEQFQWLWQHSISDSIEDFNKKIPTLSDYEEKLRVFDNTEREIDSIDLIFKIGAMSLKTESLKQGLKVWIKQWKSAYAEDLHKRAKTLLDQLSEQTKVLQSKLQKEVIDVDSLKIVMDTLEEIRQQADFDTKFSSISEMYDIYNQLLPDNTLDTEEIDARSVLRKDWESLIHQADVIEKKLQHKQATFLSEKLQA